MWLGQTADTTVEHNEIADFHYTGIASGWTWGYRPTAVKRIRIAWNHVHHIGAGILSDMAAIYTLGDHEGSEIVGNRIHDVWCYGQAGRGGRGIYTDEGSARILVASNLVYNISSGQITQHYGRDNRFVNNIFAFSRGTGEMIYHARVEKHHSFDFDHNIVIWEGVREARRMVGEYVMTEHDCRQTRRVPRPVAMAAYGMDSHNVRRLVVDGQVRNEGDVQEHNFKRPYPVEYGCIVPKRRECTNLLVPVCVSASHIAYGSIRMEPVFFALGQVAGEAAALALKEKYPVQDVPYAELKARLLAGGQVLEMR